MSFLNNPSILPFLSQMVSVKQEKKKSNGSNNISRLTSTYPLQYKYKKLLLLKKWNAGRCGNGRITVFSKGPVQRRRSPLLNYNFRQKSLTFIGGLNYTNSFSNKLSSIIFTSDGFIFYKPLITTDCLFTISKLKPLSKISNSLVKDLALLKQFLVITERPFLLLQQEKNLPISFIELRAKKGSKYTRSLGSKSKLLKLDTRTGYGLVLLPSALKKVFSIFSLASEGPAGLNIPKKSLVSNKAGDRRKLGIKPRVRGVAMNPVDHPHGGRTKTIKSPRTPWGKITKYK